MQGVQINHSILQAIFVDNSKFQPSLIKQIIQWHSQLEPSVNMTLSIISAYLLPNQKKQSDEDIYIQNKQTHSTKQLFIKQIISESQKNNDRLYKAVEDIPKTLKLLQQNKCPKNFMRAYLLLIKKNKKRVQHLINRQYMLKVWSQISPELLQSYCDVFGIQIQKYSRLQKDKNNMNQQQTIFIKSQDFDKKMQELIQKKDYPSCMTLIKFSNCQKQHINKLLSKMTNNKEASKAADYIKTLKLNPADYPALGQRLYKTTARHFLTRVGWQYAQEIFQNHPEALACVVQDLIFKKRYPQALSIWYRNQCCRQHIVKEDAILYLEPYVKSQGKIIKIQQLKANFLRMDDFGPSNRQKYFSLQDFGYRQQQIIWIDQNCKEIKQHMEQILNSQIIGIDTQSVVGQTKFQKSQVSKFQQAALIQIATPKQIYLIDGFTVKNIPQVKATITDYIKRNSLIIGHTLDNDMECLLKSLGFTDEQIKSINNPKVVDVWKLFKAVYPELKFSSLTFISQKMLGKQICKDQTLTNWRRRPLRRNQMHYAAMDAVVVLKIYQKFISQIGEQMIEYYCSVQADF